MVTVGLAKGYPVGAACCPRLTARYADLVGVHFQGRMPGLSGNTLLRFESACEAGSPCPVGERDQQQRRLDPQCRGGS